MQAGATRAQVEDVSFRIASAARFLGVADLIGSGRTELIAVLYGPYDGAI